MKTKRRVAILGAVILACLLMGCSRHAKPGRGLSERELSALSDRAVIAADAGIRLEDSPERGLRILGGRHFVTTSPSFSPTSIPFEQGLEHGPIASVTVNGRKIYALLDTGSSRSMIDYKAARRARILPIRVESAEEEAAADLVSAPADTIGGTVDQYLAVARRISIGGIELTDVAMWIPDHNKAFSGISNAGGRRVSAILGADVLGRFAHVSFDYKNKVLTVDIEEGYRPHEERIVAACQLLDDASLPLIPVRIRGLRSLAVIDTGGTFGLLVPFKLAGDLRLPVIEDTRGTEDLFGVRFGTSLHGIAWFKAVGDHSLGLGRMHLKFVPTLVAKTNFKDRDPPFAFIGNQVLSRYVVTLDYSSQVAFLEAPRN